MTRFLRFAGIYCVLAAAGGSAGFAQSSQPAQPTESDELALNQSKLADRYERLEKLILRMAEFDQTNNPRRAVLLKNAFALAKDRDIQLQLEAASRMLESEKLQGALDEQQQVRRDLQLLLDLLLTENRADRLKDEQGRVRDYIREIERLERMQRSVQGRTEGGVDVEQLKREQNQVADGTQNLFEQIQDTELADNPLDDNPGNEEDSNQEQPTDQNPTPDRESENSQSGPPSDSQDSDSQDDSQTATPRTVCNVTTRFAQSKANRLRPIRPATNNRDLQNQIRRTHPIRLTRRTRPNRPKHHRPTRNRVRPNRNRVRPNRNQARQTRKLARRNPVRETFPV